MKNISYYFLLFSLVLHAGSTRNNGTKNNIKALTVIGNHTNSENPPAVITSLWPSFCNYNLPLLNTLVGITTVAGPTTRYRIKATNGTQVQILELGVPHFTMTLFPIYDFATTYTIEIELQRNGVWVGTYGPPCTITTPEGLTGTLYPRLCGVTLKKVNSFIVTPSLQFVEGYRYRITNLTDPFGPNAVQVFYRPLNWFSLTMLERYNYGMTYKIEVALKTFGIYGPYGTACNVSTPAPPMLTNCGGTVASGATNIACSSFPLVNQYRFQIIRESDYAISTIDRNNNYFNFDMLPPATFTGNEMYNVSVAVLTSGTWSPFGESCEIVSPTSTSRITPQNSIDLEQPTIEATAYPNPFHTNFTISLTASEQAATVKVFDMLGRLVASEKTQGANQELKIGTDFPTGVYTVIINRGDTVKTIRMVKR